MVLSGTKSANSRTPAMDQSNVRVKVHHYLNVPGASEQGDRCYAWVSMQKKYDQFPYNTFTSLYYTHKIYMHTTESEFYSNVYPVLLPKHILLFGLHIGIYIYIYIMIYVQKLSEGYPDSYCLVYISTCHQGKAGRGYDSALDCTSYSPGRFIFSISCVHNNTIDMATLSIQCNLEIITLCCYYHRVAI